MSIRVESGKRYFAYLSHRQNLGRVKGTILVDVTQILPNLFAAEVRTVKNQNKLLIPFRAFVREAPNPNAPKVKKTITGIENLAIKFNSARM
jgi:hypothetical protein